MNTVEAIAAANKSTLKLVTSIQKSILEAQKEAATSLANVDQPVSLPDWVPSPDLAAAREVVEESFSLPSRLLEANKSFTLGLLDTWTPEKVKVTSKK